jgi:MinD superfamily P-loop ATPase
MMKEIVCISGKGGTGKTSVVASLATLASRKYRTVFADCDVDAADLHLVLNPEIRSRTDFYSGNVAKIDPLACISAGACKTCIDLCRFDAIHYSDRDGYSVDENSCEGCGVCVRFCPAKAISFSERYCGQWYLSDTRYGPLVHAELEGHAENSGKLVTLVRKEAKRLALVPDESGKTADLVIIDGSPGTGCPVIASITGADAVLIVTEPTLSGQHDLERVAGLARHFGVEAFVCVNKYDINVEQSRAIEAWCARNSITFVGKIPYDKMVTTAQIQGKTVIEYAEDSGIRNETTEALQKIGERIWQLKQ